MYRCPVLQITETTIFINYRVGVGSQTTQGGILMAEKEKQQRRQRRARRARTATDTPSEPQTSPEEVEAEDIEMGGVTVRAPRGKPISDQVIVTATEAVVGLLGGLTETGKAALVQEHKDGGYIISLIDTIVPRKAAGAGRYREQDYWSGEYAEFKTWWPKMTPDEKVTWAEENSVTWEEHVDPLVNNMKLSAAAQVHLGVEKYKPGFRTRAARVSGIPNSSELSE